MMPTEVERLANESFDRLCKKYPELNSYPSRGIMQASFEIFRNEIVFLEYSELCERTIKMNIRNGMRLLNYG
jgi:hypothetical protein